MIQLENPFQGLGKSEQSKENHMNESTDNNKITVTLKGGSGFDAPWIVLYGDNHDELIDKLNDEKMKELTDRTQEVAKYFASLGSGGGSSSGRQGQPQGSQKPPADAPDCPPGWTYRSGTSKAGKAYQGFFPPRGDDSKPIFF